MTHSTETEAKKNWIKSGQMNGNNRAIMDALVASIPTSDHLDASNQNQWHAAQHYISELWLRGISKKQFQMRTKASDRWIKYGEMNGDNNGIMAALYVNLPSKTSLSSEDMAAARHIAGHLMTELWLRNITKAQFMRKKMIASQGRVVHAPLPGPVNGTIPQDLDGPIKGELITLAPGVTLSPFSKTATPRGR